MNVATIYDSIGQNYATGRESDPIIAAQIHSYLAGADWILNIGAGTGSYEPIHDRLVAVEPSETMIRQRRGSPHCVIKAVAESLPFDDRKFSHSMSVLSTHHWIDRRRAFNEIARVTRNRLVIVTWDPDAAPFWLIRDYFPEIYQIDKKISPPISEFAQAFGCIEAVDLPIPATCRDGFTGAYWRRPQAYLDAAVRERMSTFSKITGVNEGLERLRNDLHTGEWGKRNHNLLDKEQLDIGYRIIIADFRHSVKSR